MAKCFRCLMVIIEQEDEYDGDVLQCLACGHKVNLDGSSIPTFPERIREPRMPKKKGVK
ncbi:hypothetical protein LCGC14_0535780 [marine sediment metagenome]|uniref:Uncharacterized protein n=1 Tax=marine sediment metagenome TaxID=412755 RepID=A0A0F9RZ03_9ZZZZ